MPNGGNSPFVGGGALGGRNPNMGNGGNYPSVNAGGRFGANSGQPPQQVISPEAQMIMIAAQHAKAQQEGDPAAPIFPPTPIDEDAGVVAPNNGSPASPSP
jgi:hypothetical protein